MVFSAPFCNRLKGRAHHTGRGPCVRGAWVRTGFLLPGP
ncbi:hypothetical protein FKM82_021473 [Ascaphus truei]